MYFAILPDFLRSVEGKKNEYCMIGYRVGNTLSESGSVSRGVCVVDDNNNLLNVVERTHIEEKGGTIIFIDEKVCKSFRGEEQNYIRNSTQF